MSSVDREYWEIIASYVGTGNWKDVRFSRDDSDSVEYIGRHMTHDAPITDIHWQIWKFTYTESFVDRIEGSLTGTWDDRAALGWGA